MGAEILRMKLIHSSLGYRGMVVERIEIRSKQRCQSKRLSSEYLFNQLDMYFDASDSTADLGVRCITNVGDPEIGCRELIRRFINWVGSGPNGL